MIFGLIFAIYMALFLVSIKLQDNSIVDVFWGMGFVIIATYFFYVSGNYTVYNIVLLALIYIWGVRLSYHIGKRNISQDKEDPRYAVWRKNWKYFYVRSFFQIYILQMLIMFVVSMPLYYIFLNQNIYVFVLGLVVSSIGLSIEILADKQLKDNLPEIKKQNKIYSGGLYKYSRHPNYFGESVFWLGLSLIGAFVNIYSLVGFVVISFLLVFVSGVPMKEKSLSKKSNRKDYKSKTSKFIPWFPKS